MKIRLAFIVLLVVVLSASTDIKAQSAPGSSYIGYKYEGVRPEQTLSNGVKHLGGGLVGDINADPVYAVSQVVKGKTRMFWLENSTSRTDKDGVTGWQVKDVLAFSSLRKTDYLLISGDPTVQCEKGGKILQTVLGLGRLDEKRNRFIPVKLWLPNVKTEKFESVPIRGFVCIFSEP